MQEDTKKVVQPDMTITNKPEVDNRKSRRTKAKLARKHFDPIKRTNWVTRFVKEMLKNKQVQQKLVDGKLDKYLEKK